MTRFRSLAIGVAAALLTVGCSSDETATSTTTTDPSEQSTTTTTLPQRLQRELDQLVGIAPTVVAPGQEEPVWSVGLNGPRTSRMDVSSDGRFVYVVGGDELPTIAAYTMSEGVATWRATPDPLAMALDIMYVDDDAVIGWFAKSDDESFIAAYDPTTGVELWKRLLTSDTEPRPEQQCGWPASASVVTAMVGRADGNYYQLVATDPATGLTSWLQSGVLSPCAVQVGDTMVALITANDLQGIPPTLTGFDASSGEIVWGLPITSIDFDSQAAQILDVGCGSYAYVYGGAGAIIPVEVVTGEFGGSRPTFVQPTVDAAAAERTTLTCLGTDVLVADATSVTRRSADLGEVRWTVDANAIGASLPNPTVTVVDSGVVISDASGAARVVDVATGVVRWGYEVGATPLVTPYTFSAATIVAATADPETRAINGLSGRDAPSGATAWTFPVEALGLWGLKPVNDGRVLALFEIPPVSGGGGGGRGVA